MSAPPLAEFHLALRSSVDIAASAAAVWTHLAQLRAWKRSVVSFERLAGPPDEEGETLRLGQRPADVTVHTIMRTLRSAAPTWKVQTLLTEDGRTTDGYVVYSLQNVGAVTRVCCDVVARCRVPLPADGDVVALARAANDSTRAKLDADHERLKRLVELGHV